MFPIVLVLGALWCPIGLAMTDYLNVLSEDMPPSR